MSLLQDYAKKVKDYATRPQETVVVAIKAIRGTSDDRRVMIDSDKGIFFAWKNSFPSETVPIISKPLNATLTLEKRVVGEDIYINVVQVQYDPEELGKFAMVATFGNAVQL